MLISKKNISSSFTKIWGKSTKKSEANTFDFRASSMDRK